MSGVYEQGLDEIRAIGVTILTSNECMEALNTAI